MQHVKKYSELPNNRIQKAKQYLENKCEFCQISFCSTYLLKYHLENTHEQRLKDELLNIKKDLQTKKITLQKRIHNLNMEIIILLLSKF